MKYHKKIPVNKSFTGAFFKQLVAESKGGPYSKPQ